jgi:membrane protein YdbS with pleckstrin-like domain
MAYPRRLINQGEEVVVDLNPHWFYFAKQILAGVGVLLLLFLAFSWDWKPFWYLVALAFVAFAGWVVVRYLGWRTTYFVVTNKRIISRQGVVARRGHEIPLDRISNINFTQRIWERMIGTGDLLVESAGESGQSTFSDITNPEYVQQEIYRQIEVYDQRRAAGFSVAGTGPPPYAGAPAAPPGPPQYAPPGGPVGPPHGPTAAADIPTQLAQLAELRDRGVLTNDEFEAKKRELLGRL